MHLEVTRVELWLVEIMALVGQRPSQGYFAHLNINRANQNQAPVAEFGILTFHFKKVLVLLIGGTRAVSGKAQRVISRAGLPFFGSHLSDLSVRIGDWGRTLPFSGFLAGLPSPRCSKSIQRPPCRTKNMFCTISKESSAKQTGTLIS